jgi:hypothetical protein
LAILAILLNALGDLDGVGYLKNRVIDCASTALRFVDEGKVLGSECLYDLAARRVSAVVVINL